MQVRFTATVIATVLLAAGAGAPGVRDAERCLARGDTLEAIRVLEHSHLDKQHDPRGYVLLGQLWRSRGTIEARLRSQHVLEAARVHWGNDPSVLLELGRTYFAQGFLPDGLACFHGVLDRNPKNCDARFMVGLYHYRNWKRMQHYTDDLAAARRNLRAAVECDPDNVDAALLYLYANYASGDTSSAECDRELARHPERYELHMFRGLLDFDAGRFASSSAHFQRGLELAPPDIQDSYAALAPVLPVQVLDVYDRAGQAAQPLLQRGFWLGADPDPTTPLNECSLEHVRRMFVSDVLYSHPAGNQRGWETDRGEVLVKFGKPLTVDYTLGDDVPTGRINGWIETWSYVLGGVFHQFLFVDEFLNGNPRIPYRLDVLLSFVRYSPAVSTVATGVVPLSADTDVTAFRDSDLSSSVYVAIQVDADSLRAAVDLSRVDHLVTRCACFDETWNREGGAADTAWVSQLGVRPLAGRQVVERVCRLAVPFDRYHVAVALEDQGASARAVARADADASRFGRDGLAVSDILLFDTEDSAASAPRGGAIERAGARMQPRVGHRYFPGERVRVYFEAYNLDVTAGVSTYEVRIAIYPASDEESPAWLVWTRHAAEWAGIGDDEPAVAQSFRREGRRHTESESIAIDIDALRPGRYRLLVELTDLHSGERAVAHTPLIREASAVVSER